MWASLSTLNFPCCLCQVIVSNEHDGNNLKTYISHTDAPAQHKETKENKKSENEKHLTISLRLLQ